MSTSMQTGIAGVVVIVVGRLAAAGRLPRNRFAGIRIPSTMHSDSAWLAGHRAGGPALTVAGIGPVVAAVADRAPGPDEHRRRLLARAATIWLLGWIGWATYRANTAARGVADG